MSTVSSQPFDWLEEIPTYLQTLDQKPQFGPLKEFPWQPLTQSLRETFGKPDLTIKPYSKMGWYSPDQLFEGIGEDPFISPLIFSPLKTPIYWVMSKQDIQGLLSAFLEVPIEQAQVLEQDIYQGFLHFMIVEVLGLIDHSGFSYDLSPRLDKLDVNWSKEKITACFRKDVSINVEGRNLWGRVLIPESFRTEWKQHFLLHAPPILEPEIAKKILLDVAFEVAYSELLLSEWKEARPGDFIILDHCSYDPETKSGRIILTFNGKPIFRAKIKDDELKLLEYPLYEDLGLNMAKDVFDEDFFDDEDEFEDDEDEDEENEVIEEDEDEEDEEIDEEEPEEELSKKEEQHLEEKKSLPLTPENLPVQLVVEVGRLKITASELMALQPGNLINMKVSPEQGVDLVLNGRKVGKGELVKMGEVLGVRIVRI